jgi:hypothetical protein
VVLILLQHSQPLHGTGIPSLHLVQRPATNKLMNSRHHLKISHLKWFPTEKLILLGPQSETIRITHLHPA